MASPGHPPPHAQGWEFRKIVDISFIGAMGLPGGGRQIVTNRFLRYFNFIAFPELEDSSMKTIFKLILGTFVEVEYASFRLSQRFFSPTDRAHVSSAFLRPPPHTRQAYLPVPVLAVVEPIIDASIKLYNTLLKELLPTPAKPHYTFNMRDLASVVQGMLSADTKTVCNLIYFNNALLIL